MALKMLLMRNVLFCTIAMALCLYCASALAQEAITTPILSTAPNFRDIAGISASNGGTGFVNTTSNGGVMRTGVFYRANTALRGRNFRHFGVLLRMRFPSCSQDTRNS